MSYLEVLFYSAVFCFLIMLAAWYVAQKLDFYSLVDGVWAYGIGLLALLYIWVSKGAMDKKILVLIMSLSWSLRLGTYLGFRLKSHYPQEDRRYGKLKNHWGKKQFLFFFLFQGVSQVILALPFLLLAQDPSEKYSSLVIVGVLIFILGLVGESIADKQLRRFKQIAINKNQVCRQGLWKYSRHPNYFFEWLVWCGISLTALASPYGYLGLISPLLMYLTLNYLTGIPAVEEQALKTKGDLYGEYQKTTNRFYPGVPL